MVTLVAVIVGLQWGPVGIAAAYSVARVALWPASVSYCFHGTILRWRDMRMVIWRPAVASAIAGVVAGAALFLWDEPRAAARLVGCFALFSATYGIAMLAMPGGLAIARDSLHLCRELQFIGRRDENT